MLTQKTVAKRYMIEKNQFLCTMNRRSNINMYEGVASYFLPAGVLEYFEVTDFCEVPTQDTEVLYTTELHI